MGPKHLPLLFAVALLPSLYSQRRPVTPWSLIGWNDLRMHCVDGKDDSIDSILPPYNTFHAQLLDSTGKLVKSNTGITVTYQSVADSDGFIHKTTANKTNFWQYVLPLLGANLPPDTGLTGFKMAGLANVPQTMRWDLPYTWFTR